MIEKFKKWERESGVDYVSYRVLRLLFCKYMEGNPDALFGKFAQLIRDQHYDLCVIFRDFIIYMGLKSEYEKWKLESWLAK